MIHTKKRSRCLFMKGRIQDASRLRMTVNKGKNASLKPSPDDGEGVSVADGRGEYE